MRLLLAIVATCLALGVSGSAYANDRRANSVPGWEAVGRLNISGKYMCTASLIAPNLVLTAAHCMYDVQNGRQFSAGSVRFEAGLDGRQSKAVRKVSKIVLHPGYRFGATGQAKMGHDLAVLRLESPISSAQIRPFDMSGQAQRGEMLNVLSYSLNNSSRANRQQGCQVMARQIRMLVMSCKVDYGASGAPVLQLRPGYPPRIVSVISSKAEVGRRPVALGTEFDATLLAMMRSAI